MKLTKKNWKPCLWIKWRRKWNLEMEFKLEWNGSVGMEWNESNEREFSGMQFPRHDNTIRTWPDLMRAKAASNWIHGTSFHSISWTMEYAPAMTRTTTTRTATSSSSSTLLLGRMTNIGEVSQNPNAWVGGFCFTVILFSGLEYWNTTTVCPQTNHPLPIFTKSHGSLSLDTAINIVCTPELFHFASP